MLNNNTFVWLDVQGETVYPDEATQNDVQHTAPALASVPSVWGGEGSEFVSSPHVVSCCTGCSQSVFAKEGGGPEVSDRESGDLVPSPCGYREVNSRSCGSPMTA